MMATLTKLYIRNLYHTFVCCKSLLWPNFTIFRSPLCGHGLLSKAFFWYIFCIYQKVVCLPWLHSMLLINSNMERAFSVKCCQLLVLAATE